nr:E3 ubiquitin-protein ligase NEURL3 [Anolis sagrei ordinatus]
MGACLCPPNDCDNSRRGPYGPLFFHPYVKGSQIVMDESHRVARRVATFRNGLVFSNRPVGVYEKVALRISKDDGKWHGGLRVGFTWEDPSRLNPQDLPPFACPNLIQRGKTRACLLPDEHCEEGTVVSFWVDARGRVLYNINGEPEQFLLLDGVLVTSPLWAVVDIYGRTRAIQLLDPSSLSTNHDIHRLPPLTCKVFKESNCRDFSHLSEKQSHNECVICLEHESSAMMLPCSHANFCSDCSLKVLKTSRQCPLCRRKVKKILNFSVF